MTEKQRVSEVKNFLAGGFGGICTVISGHPFDTIKVRLQTQPKPASGQPAMYAGTLDCVKKTVKHEGIRATVILAPGERIKCLLQVQQAATGPPKYKGPVDVAKSLFREGGIRSVYKGSVATLLRDVPASAAYFGSYELIQRAMVSGDGDRSDLSIGKTIFAGGMAGVFNWIIGIGPDVMKSRLQTAPEGTYNGVRDVFRQIVREEGVRGFTKGAVPVLLRAFPANACCFLGYEVAMYGLNYAAPNL